MINTWTWFLWVTGVLVTLSSTRNPLYLILILLCLVVVDLSFTKLDRTNSGEEFLRIIPLSPLKIAILLVGFSAVFNVVISHFGETIIFTLPANLPLVGGPITLEALVYGSINGIILFGIFYTFMIMNRALSIRRLIRIVPKAFYPVAIVTSIAITFVPNTVRQFHQIKEAQAIRGHNLHGLRDWLPLLMPLLIGGVERALALAESMSARGLAQRNEGRNIWWARSLLIFGITLVLAGLFFQLTIDWQAYGKFLLILGVITVLTVLWSVGRQKPHSTYVHESWRLTDLIIISGVIFTLVAFLIPLSYFDKGTLNYEVYPKVYLPSFDPLIGIALLGLLLPVLFLRPAVGEDKP